MALIKKYQNNFTTGVISPSAYARADLQKYAAGCEKIVNAVVRAYGGLSKRPGSYYVDEVAGPGLLFPFIYSVEDSYVLLMYDDGTEFAKMRVYRAGAPVESGGAVYETTTPYRPNELRALKFAQSADVLFIAHEKHPPMKLSRYAADRWVFETIKFYPSIQAPKNLAAVASGFTASGHTAKHEISYKVSAVDGREGESLPSEAVKATQSGSTEILVYWPEGAKVELTWDAVPGAARYEVYKNTIGYYEWLGSVDEPSFTDDNRSGDKATGPKENRDPFNPPDTPENLVLTAGTIGTPELLEVRVSAVNSGGAESVACVAGTVSAAKDDFSATWGKVDTAESYYVYVRGEDGEWENVSLPGGTASTVEFTAGTGTEYLPGAPLDEVKSYPGAVGIYQQRLIFGRTASEPQTVWMSETGAFDSMAVANPLRDDSAITVTVDSRQMNEIRHFVPLKDALMMTSGAEFVVSAGKNADAVTPTTVSFSLQSYWGCSDVPPVVSGTSIVFAENSSLVVRDFQYHLADDGYTGSDLSILAKDLLDSPITDWAYQQDPYSTIWTILESGKLLSFTYMKEQEVWAWAEHESEGASSDEDEGTYGRNHAKFLSVCSIREGAEDQAYFLVKRFGRYFVEMQDRRAYGDPETDAFFVDCGMKRLPNGTKIAHVTGLNHLAGREIVVLADGSVVRGITVDQNGAFDLPEPADAISAGLPYTMEVVTVDPEINGQDGTTVGERKTAVLAVLMVRETLGLKVGPDKEHLTEVKFPAPAKWGDPPVLFSGLREVTLPGVSREKATVTIRQDEPLPATVLSVVTHVQVK